MDDIRLEVRDNALYLAEHAPVEAATLGQVVHSRARLRQLAFERLFACWVETEHGDLELFGVKVMRQINNDPLGSASAKLGDDLQDAQTLQAGS
jgi:hypothetical protein